MDAFVDREFQQLVPPHPSPRNRDFFGRMVVISLVIHVISSVILLSPQRSALHLPTVSYLDLRTMQFQEEAQPSPPEEQKTVKTDDTKIPPSEPPSEAEKLQRDVQQALANAEKNPASLQERSFGLGLTNGHFSSIAEGESLRGDIREYYFSMLRQINEKWWLNREAQQGGFRGAIITVTIARNGTILEKMLVRSSGNPAFDRAMLQTLDAASPLPPLPANYELDYFSAPLKFVGPLNLLTS